MKRKVVAMKNKKGKSFIHKLLSKTVKMAVGKSYSKACTQEGVKVAKKAPSPKVSTVVLKQKSKNASSQMKKKASPLATSQSLDRISTKPTVPSAEKKSKSNKNRPSKQKPVAVTKSSLKKSTQDLKASKSTHKKVEAVVSGQKTKTVAKKKKQTKKITPVKKVVQRAKKTKIHSLKQREKLPSKSSDSPKTPISSPAKTLKKSISKSMSSQKSSKSTQSQSTQITTSKVTMKNKKISDLKKELSILNEKKQDGQMIKDAQGRRYCHDEHCDQPAVTDIYCRYHYLALWSQIQNRKKLLDEGYLLQTTHHLIRHFGENVLSFMLNDLRNDKSFESALKEINPGFFKNEEAMLPPSEDIEF